MAANGGSHRPPPLTQPFTLLSLILGALTLIPLGSPTCYNIDGSADDNFSRCDNTSTHSMCCNLKGGAEVCLPFGICSNNNPSGTVLPIEVGHAYWRGPCTDKTWSDDACLYFGEDQTSNGARLTPCGDGSWCERMGDKNDPNEDCCDAGKGTMTRNMKKVKSKISSSSASVITTTVTPTGSSSSVDSATVITGTESNVPSSTASAAAAASTTSTSISQPAVIGLSVALALLLAALLTVLVFFLLASRRRRRELAALKDPPYHQSPFPVAPLAPVPGSQAFHQSLAQSPPHPYLHSPNSTYPSPPMAHASLGGIGTTRSSMAPMIDSRELSQRGVSRDVSQNTHRTMPSSLNPGLGGPGGLAADHGVEPPASEIGGVAASSSARSEMGEHTYRGGSLPPEAVLGAAGGSGGGGLRHELDTRVTGEQASAQRQPTGTSVPPLPVPAEDAESRGHSRAISGDGAATGLRKSKSATSRKSVASAGRA